MNMFCVKSRSNFNRYRLRNISCHTIKSSVRSDYSRITAENAVLSRCEFAGSTAVHHVERAPLSFASGSLNCYMLNS
jgi:hypothetical protein